MPIGERWRIGVLAGLAATVYALVSLRLFWRLDAHGYDLGIFDQTVWHYSRFEAPGASVRGLGSIFGDHFSPILVLLAPLYWIWSDPRTLLLAQAALLAAGAVPVFLYAVPRIGRAGAYGLAAAYLAFWGIQSAVGFDFHEFAFAPVLIGGVLLAARAGHWRKYFALLIALLCVKEDLSVLAVFLGVYVWTLGARRQGLATVLLAVAWYALTVRLIIPHNSHDGYEHWSYDAFGHDGPSALLHALTHPWQVVSTALDNGTKRHTIVLLLAPVLGLALVSRTAILLAPLMFERFLSSTATYWGTSLHYSLPMAAILFIGAADGLSTLRAPRQLVPVIVALNVAVTLSFSTGYRDLLRSWRTPETVRSAERALAAIPPRASVVATNDLLARLAERDSAYEITARSGSTDYVIADVLDTGPADAQNGSAGTVSRYLNQALADHAPVAYDEGWLVLRRGGAPPPAALAPITGARATRLRTAAAAWSSGFARYEQTLFACGTQSDVPGCLRAAPAAPDPARFESAVTAISPGCGQLSALALRATRDLTTTLAAVRAAGEDGNTAAAAAPTARLKQLTDDDAAGRVQRFVALCAS